MSDLAIINPTQNGIVLSETEIMHQLRLMYVGAARKLPDDEMKALAMYAFVNQMNPTLGECYYLPNVGPYAGIAFYIRKSKEIMMAEAKTAGEPWGEWTAEYFVATAAEIGFTPAAGDIVIKCVVKDTLSSKVWRKALNEQMEIFHRFCEQDYLNMAKNIVGQEPHWDGIGVVYTGENFTRDNKPDKFNRKARCEKRALLAALKRRFERLNAYKNPPEADVEPAECNISVETPGQMQLPDPVDPEIEYGHPRQSTAEILEDLGYTTKPAPERTLPLPETKMSIETALEVTTNKGHRYGDFCSDELFDLHNIIEREIKANGLDEAKLTDLKFRRDAIRTIWNKEPKNG